MKLVYSALVLLTVAACGDVASASSRLFGEEDRLAERDLGWVDSKEQIKEIVALAKSGKPIIDLKSDMCDGALNDALGVEDPTICVNQVNLPSDVYLQIKEMNNNRFKVESDYDQRATRLYVLRHDGSLTTLLTPDEMDILMVALGIPAKMGAPYIDQQVRPVDYKYLQLLKGLHTEKNGWEEHPAAYRFVNGVLRGKKITTYTWATEVGLYPGGGFTTKFAVYISPTHLIFVKTEGWNS